jgi:hypothetical protein
MFAVCVKASQHNYSTFKKEDKLKRSPLLQKTAANLCSTGYKIKMLQVKGQL